MKQYQLNELIKHITCAVLKEMGTPLGSSLSGKDENDPNADSSVPPTDAMSPALKARVDRENDKQRRDNIKNKEAELKTTKSKMETQKRESDQMRRITKPGLEKDIQRLKGAKV
jgi:hypothetical protein